jgi:hypothetical protein
MQIYKRIQQLSKKKKGREGEIMNVLKKNYFIDPRN